jgi:hypothetical protein
LGKLVSIEILTKKPSASIGGGSSLCISLIPAALPIGWIGFMRFANQNSFDDYVKTGIYVSCTTDEIRMLQKFYYNGDLYVEIGDEFGGNKFELGQAVANAKDSDNLINIVLAKILNYNDEATIYSVKNDSGYTILKYGWYKYCREIDKDKIKNYYQSLDEFKYSYYEFGSGGEDIDMDFKKEVFEMLLNKYNSGEAIVTITDDDAVEYSIDQTSPDGIYSRSVNVLLANDSAYVVSKSGLPENEILSAFERMKLDKEAPLNQQLEWLRQIGFQDVSCIYKYYSFAVMFGRKKS